MSDVKSDANTDVKELFETQAAPIVVERLGRMMGNFATGPLRLA